MITKQHPTTRLAILVVLLAVAVTACFTGPPYGWPGEARESDLPFCDILTREEVAPALGVDIARVLESPGSNDATGHETTCEWSVVAPDDDPPFDTRATLTVSTVCTVKETPPNLGGPTGAVVEPVADFSDGQAWLKSWDEHTHPATFP
ncbi:MAG: hypothetical protein IT198_16580 [Acidimicrobiia bacterium]|nr:hypothetical protein [Acidimicrobiia bacterium]